MPDFWKDFRRGYDKNVGKGKKTCLFIFFPAINKKESGRQKESDGFLLPKKKKPVFLQIKHFLLKRTFIVPEEAYIFSLSESGMPKKR